MAIIDKIAASIVLVITVKIIACHQEPFDGQRIDTSEESDEETIRRNFNIREQKYDGLPIELPSRRSGESSTTTTTTVIVPPMDPRYRRVYNPDETAHIEEYPFMASLLMNNKLWCGAVIMGPSSVLTAAHCLQLQYNNRFFREYVKMLTVRVGSANSTAGGQVVDVSEIYFHPNYKAQTLEFNFAVLKLNSDLVLGKNNVNKIEFSRSSNIPVNENILFLGWGSVLGYGGPGGDVLLQKVQLPIYDLSDCQEIYGRELVTHRNFCAGYITLKKNVCNHDAGGPAIVGGKLVGILSFSSKRCDEVDKPAVFSSITPVLPWLENLGDKQVQLKDTALILPSH